MPGRVTFVTWIVLDDNTKEQRHPGVRVDAASRSSGHVLEGRLGLEKSEGRMGKERPVGNKGISLH